MQSYHLTDEFTDIAAEQAILASLMQSPKLYWDLLDLLTPEVFTKEADTWKALALALETSQLPGLPSDWLSIWRGLCIFLVTVGFGLLGDGLRQSLERR
jgi:hypothetical protein